MSKLYASVAPSLWSYAAMVCQLQCYSARRVIHGSREFFLEAETVADEAAAELIGFLATDGAVDQYLADQLILPLALAPGTSKLRTSKITQHLLTNTEVIKMFLPAKIEITGELNQPGHIQITRTGFPS